MQTRVCGKLVEEKMRTNVHTANHMATNKDNGDPDNGVYCVILCMTHQEAGENTGEVLRENGSTETVMTHSFNSQRASVIPSGSVGLDSMSSVDVFGDRRLLPSIRTTASRMTIVCNAVKVSITQKGDLAGYGPVQFHPSALANILSLSNVRKRYKVRYDSDVGDFFMLERQDGSTRIFRPTSKGLYALQMIEPDSEVAMISTFDRNAEEFIEREVKCAK